VARARAGGCATAIGRWRDFPQVAQEIPRVGPHDAPMATTMEPPTAPDGPPAVLGPPGAGALGAPPGRAASEARSGGGAARVRWVQRLGRGPGTDPRWARPALIVLLGATALLYLWGLGASGWANSFYSAAVQAGTESWKAFFFGSSDSANSITVDKPPVALWVMGISARIFGVNAWSILVPQALAGVASVGVLHTTVKRWYGPAAGLIAGAVLALTPVATLMFRFNNPDAFLVLLLIGAAYALLRAVEVASTRWLLLAWSLVGTAFLTKMLQALLVAPAFALVYLVCAPTSFRRRVVQSACAFGALVVSAGWWIAIVELWPASSRPYIGGSQENSILELVLGYNGLGRLTGNETGSVGGGGGGGTGMWGETGWNRMFNSEFGSQAGWLIPAALGLLAIGLVLRGRAPRADRSRAAYLVWGGWLVVTMAAFSFGQGIIHPYYAVALAPAIGALVGMGAVDLWKRRDSTWARVAMGIAVAGTSVWAYALMHRTPDWAPALQTAVLVGGLAVGTLLAVAPRLTGRAGAGLAIAAIVVGLAGPAAYSLQTASVTHAGSLPSAGPGTSGGPGGAMRGGPGAGAGGGGFPGGGQPPAMPGGAPTGTVGGAATGPGAAGGGAAQGNAGGLLTGSTPSDEVTALLQADAGDHTWVAAAVGSNSASGFQLAAGEPVMAIGGFNGSDPSPTLEAFQQYVADGEIHYFISGGGGMGGGMGGSGSSSEISAWVQANFTATTVDGITLYDLTA
jgi:4-amino-4-deoxy-L-arabinose transferase-like glycosyltransferase